MNKYLLLIEGMDCTGKSTFINNLISFIKKEYNINFNLIHNTFPKGNSLEERYGYQMGLNYTQMEMLQQSNDNWIFDRSFLGEETWSKLYRKREATYLKDIINLYTNLKNYKKYFIYIDCDPKVVIQRFKLYRKNETCPKLPEYSKLQLDFKNNCFSILEPDVILDTTYNPSFDILWNNIKYIFCQEG